MTTTMQTVDMTPVDILTLATVNSGTAYTITNRGQSVVYWSDAAAAPEINERASHPILPNETWTLRPTGPQWLWCNGGSSVVAISEAA